MTTFAELTPPYSTIVADPPWPHNDAPTQRQRSVGKAAFLPYATMRIDDIGALPVADLAAPAAHMFLWTTSRFLPLAFDILRAWRVRYIKTLTWCKEPQGHGGGGSFAQTTEFILYGRFKVGSLIRAAREARGMSSDDLFRAVRGGPRTGIVPNWEWDYSLPTPTDWDRLNDILGLQGSMPDDLAPCPSTWWVWPRRTHSEKPAAFYDLVDNISPPGQRVDLFTRQQRLGWDSWGHGYELREAGR